MLMGLAALGAQPAFAQATATNPVPLTTPNPGVATPNPTSPVVAGKPGDIVHIAPTPGVGMPTDKISLQPQVTPIGQEAAWFHNDILVPMMAIISIFVLILLIWVIIRYNARANPTASHTHHNTLIEIVWTLVPVMILVAIAVPSIRLLAHQYETPKADLTSRRSATNVLELPMIQTMATSRSCPTCSRKRARRPARRSPAPTPTGRACSRSMSAWSCPKARS